MSHQNADRLADGSRLTLAIGSDHLGIELKQELSERVGELGYAVTDFGCAAGVEVDYPDIAITVARAVAAHEFDRAILVCGTGVGMAIAANKVAGVRAASVTDVYSAERASMSNNAQVLCLGALVVGRGLAFALVDRWLAAEFAGGQSARKVAKINALDVASTDLTEA